MRYFKKDKECRFGCWESEACDECDPVGAKAIAGASVECHSCDGRGQVWDGCDGANTCYACHGQGSVRGSV